MILAFLGQLTITVVWHIGWEPWEFLSNPYCMLFYT